MTKRILELFCGTKSVGQVFEQNNYEVISLDYNPKFNATHTEDILTWNYQQYPSGYFDVIWASPDCTTWSIATSGKYRTKANIWGLQNEHQPKTIIGHNMVLRVIEILTYFKPNVWFIENPRGLLQHFPPLKRFVDEEDGNMTLVYYANYNWGFPKPTNIWSNLILWNETNPVMPEDTYFIHTRSTGKKVRYYHSYMRKSEERSKIPPDLINRLRLLIPNEV